MMITEWWNVPPCRCNLWKSKVGEVAFGTRSWSSTMQRWGPNCLRSSNDVCKLWEYYTNSQFTQGIYLPIHSSQFQSLCWMKTSSKTLQNLSYFMYTKNQSCFFPFFISYYFIFSLMKCPCLCRHRSGHSLGKNIKFHEMKNGKSNFGFSYI